MDSKTILIVDDNSDLRKSLSNIFEAKGYRTIDAATGKAAIDKAREEMPDVALIDLRLKDMFGLDVMRELKECSPSIECVLLTAYASQASAIDAVNLGAYSYVRKPFDTEILLETIRRAIEKREAAETLRESEQRYRMIFDHSPLGIVHFDQEGVIIECNEKYADIIGAPKDVLIGHNLLKLMRDGEARWEIEDTLKKGSGYFEGDYVSEISNRKMTIKAKHNRITSENGEFLGAIGIFEDITEKKKTEIQLQQAQKMEAIGTLAGGIAHDFNNLLMGIQGNTSLMLMQVDSAHPFYERLKNIEKQVESGARLTSHLLGYARKGQYEVKPINLNHLIKETSDTFGRAKKEIVIYRELSDDLHAIEADPGQIEQVLLNLYVNAADAMPGGGKLILKTENTTHNNIKGKMYKPKPGNYVVLTVADTGIGMDKETMERIFDPFFTTKEMGRGTGLGLASAYGIIKAHGGYIDVESRKGHGTIFRIYLPASANKAVKAVKSSDEFVRGAGMALLVDDETIILEVGKDLLEAMGYRVLTARNGKEAIELYRKNQDEIDIVLLDMVMPNMSGGEAYDRLKKIAPDIKVLLSSGYSLDGQATEILKRGCDGFIQKPFTLNELSAKIIEVLAIK
ncbi:MAG: response regulator [Proteobacteria bacterium]|nr:response regulator [Pseudomonadota bacterium]MBU4287874.1 response regulator [Pseudomonadota bacterium]MBU4415117.1 response regulator [Pseudomonadota bacterium]MCG2757065.1 response regulator [Desulfobacteraceae bacterium]